MDVIRLLIIEDDEIDQRTMKKALSKSFLNVDPTFIFSLKEVDSKLDENWDLIITDYHLPQNNGVEVLKYLKEEKKLNIPILVMTGIGSEQIAREAMEAGAFDFLTKNLITPEGIGLAIRNALRVYKKQIEADELLDTIKKSEVQLVETQRIAGLGSWEYNFVNDVLIWTEQTYKIFGRDPSKGAWTHQEFVDSVIEEDRDILIDAINNALHRKVSYEVIVRHSKEDSNEIIYVSGRGVPYMEEGEVTRLHGTLMDVTKQKEAEVELINARLGAENMARIKQDFLANMSHEIRTPMNAILGFTDIALNDELSINVRKNLDRIKQAGNNLLVIINDILDFSKIDAGQLEIESVQFDLVKCLEDTIGQLEGLASQKNLRLFLNINKEVPRVLKGDPVRLSQILINLLNNAIKFTKKGFIELRVDLLENHSDSFKLQFEVEDTGIGIPKSKQAKMFESFTQATTDTTRKYGGTGLGLAICKSLVELQNGEIWIESEQGVGSTFKFIIDFDVCGQDQEVLETSVKIEDIDLSGVKVLLVEDNQMNRELASHFLKQWDVDFDLAENGKEGIKKIEANDYEVVLMDISMPIMDGYTATTEIRAVKGPKSNVPIIAMTANAFSSDIEKCKEIGMNDHISKPFKAFELKQKIGDWSKRGEKVMLELSDKANPIAKEEGITEKKTFVSLATLEEMGGGYKDFINDMLKIYNEETPTTLNRIIDAVEANDLEALKAAAHKFRSPAGLLCLTEAVELAEFIELNVYNENKFEEIEIAVKKLVKIAKFSLEETKGLIN